MLAMLGDITFNLRLAPKSWDVAKSYDYAEHKVMEAPPVLQWLGNGLEARNLSLIFDHSFCVVEQELARLQQAGDDHAPLPLVTGDGQSHGYHVITAISTTARVMNAKGGLQTAEVSISLKEVAGPPKPPTPKLKAPDLNAVREQSTPAPQAGAGAVPPQQITRR